MSKNYLLNGFFILFTTVLVSCSGSDDSNGGNSNDLVGTWKYAGYYDAVENEFFADDLGECYNETFTFNADGTATYYEKNCSQPVQTYDFEWSMNGGKINFVGPDGSYEMPITFKTSNRIYVVEDEDGSADVYDRQ